MDKRRGGTYIQWNLTLPLKNNEILPFLTMWVDPEGVMLSEISQMGKCNSLISIPDLLNQKLYLILR